jgi:hypothetical protein
MSGVFFLVSSEAIPSHFHIYCSAQTQLHLCQFFGFAEAQIVLLQIKTSHYPNFLLL